MKNNIIITLLLFIIGALVLNTFYGWVTPNKAELIAAEVQDKKTDPIKLENKTAIIGKDTIRITEYIPNSGQLMENNITKNYNTYVLDTLAPALKIATNKIAELQQVKATLEGKLKAEKINTTIAKVNEIYFKDKYFQAVTRTDTLGNSTLDYKYNAQIDVLTERKSRFLRKDLETVYITSPDPNFKINGVEHFKKEIYTRPKNFGIGLQAGYYYIPSSRQLIPAIGLGVSYNLIKF